MESFVAGSRSLRRCIWQHLPVSAPWASKVVRLSFDADGKPTGEYEDFMTGFVPSDSEIWRRPLGVAVANDGAPFITEDGNGTIWRVTYDNHAQ
jgi:glucose/arabinose dehydrogenase